MNPISKQVVIIGGGPAGLAAAVELKRRGIQDVLVRTPPQLASDIFDDGIVLSGGAAGLARLPEAIYTALHIPCGVADDPQTSVVLGCGIAVEDPGAYASLLDDGRKGFKRL